MTLISYSIAGFESTTITSGFAVWELARHPDKQQRLRAELNALNGEPTFNDFQNRLPYLDCILKETQVYPNGLTIDTDIMLFGQIASLSWSPEH